VKGLLLAALLLLMMSGCAGGSPSDDPSPSPVPQPTPEPSAVFGDDPPSDGFPFEAYGLEVWVGKPASGILAAFPEPDDIFESPSCAFEGVDITYFYPGFELTTYPFNGEEHFLSVMLTDDSVRTPEGVTLGGTYADMAGGYNGGYDQNGNQYTYTNGKGKLVVTIREGFITGIFFTLIIGG
jgi:hypothetical protein